MAGGATIYDCRDCDYCLCVQCFDDAAESEETDDFPDRAWEDGLGLLREKIGNIARSLKLDEPQKPSPELLSECRTRCSTMIGLALFAGSVDSIVRTCLGDQNLSAVGSLLQLRQVFKRDWEKADLARSCLEALLKSKGARPASSACEAMIDFVCFVGLSHFVAVGVTRSFEPSEPTEGPCAVDDEPEEESEEAARARRVEAQQQKKSTRRWDYTGGYRPVEPESNEQATLRLINARGNNLKPKAAEDERQAEHQGPEDGSKTKTLYKRHLCLYFERGHCEKGLHCTFAHGLDELRDPREDRARPSAAEPEGKRTQEMPRRFKRDLCVYWQQGTCQKGSACTFAHGSEELVDSRSNGIAVHQGPSWETGPMGFRPEERRGANSKPTRKMI